MPRVEPLDRQSAPRRSVLAIALMASGLAACVSQPVQLASAYAPQDTTFSAANRGTADGNAPCRILLAGVQDLRDDPEAAGLIGYRFVHANDAIPWLRSGLLSMARDPRLSLSDQIPASVAQLVIRVDLLKIYMLPINQAKSANVVIRIHYADPNAAPDDQIYRGISTSLNWADASSETQGAFDTALTKLLQDVDHDLLTHCAAKTTGGH
jgi:hypothetical protein